MQLQVLISLCLVFVYVVDSRSTDFQRRNFLQGYRAFSGSREVTTVPPHEIPDEPAEYPETDEDWPYAMMEFTSLLGRCITSRFVAERMPNKPRDKFLTYSCPLLFEAVQSESIENVKDEVKKFGEEHFRVLQCANLMAEKNNVEAVLKNSRRPMKSRHFSPPGLRAETTADNEWSVEDMTNVLLEESRELYGMCEQTLADAIKNQEHYGEETKPEERFIFLTAIAITTAITALG